MDSTQLACEQFRLQRLEVTQRMVGRGSHTDVVEVYLMGLMCVAKKFRFAKIEMCRSMQDEYNRLCYEHCKLLGRLRHPNIVQFLGFYSEPGNKIPTFVYEHLHITLSSCLSRYGILPDSTSYSILKDTAMALRYLHEHSTPIPHRSLSASKILLTRDMTAKLADIQVTDITELEESCPQDLEPQEHRSTQFLPKKIIQPSIEAEVKKDIYSFGLLTVHVLTGRDIQTELRLSGCFQFNRSMSISEPDIVEGILSKIRDENPLLNLIEQCLDPSPNARPSTITILQKMVQISANHPLLFPNSLEMLQRIDNDTKNHLNLQAKIKKLSPQHSRMEINESEVDQLRELVTKLSAQNMALQAKLNARSNSVVSENGDEKIKLIRQENQYIHSPYEIQQGHMKWTKCSDMPISMFQAHGVYLKNKIYIGGGDTGDSATDTLVLEYDLRRDSWKSLPPTITTYFGLCKLEDELVSVGGKLDMKATAAVLVYDTFTRRWKDSLPYLYHARSSPSCTSVSSAIIVCGGLSKTGDLLSSVEVMKSDTFQWYTAGYLSLLATLCHTSIIAINDTLYILGGYKSFTASSSSNNAHSSSINMLLSYSGMTPYAWVTLPATPHLQSTAASVGTCLLSLGGTSNPYSTPVHSSVYAYSPSTKSWIHAGGLPYEFCHGTAVSLPNNELYIMGGWVRPGKSKRSCNVYKGTITK